MVSSVSLGIAFVAGLISFLAPCVLPLLPGYVAFLAGASLKEAEQKRSSIILAGALFVVGFSLVFALLGVLLNSLLEAVAYDALTWFARIGGVVVIFFGLYLIGLFRIPILEREHKFTFSGGRMARPVAAFLFGAAFAAGWTPCAGAALGAILGLATTQPGAAFPLLLSYSLGFGIPFFLLSIFIAQSRTVIRRVIPYIRPLNIIFGSVLVIFGVMIATQTLQRYVNFEFVSRWLAL